MTPHPHAPIALGALVARLTGAGLVVRTAGADGGDVDGVEIARLTADSRAAAPGVAFFATRGESADGHAFLGAAIAAGVREFVSIAVVADTGVPISPCGACRQVLAEFGVPRVILANWSERLEFGLAELLPRASSGILDRPE